MCFEEVGGKPIYGAGVILLQTLLDCPSHLLFSLDFLLSSYFQLNMNKLENLKTIFGDGFP